jgi:hypothetical protein
VDEHQAPHYCGPHYAPKPCQHQMSKSQCSQMPHTTNINHSVGGQVGGHPKPQDFSICCQTVAPTVSPVVLPSHSSHRCFKTGSLPFLLQMLQTTQPPPKKPSTIVWEVRWVNVNCSNIVPIRCKAVAPTVNPIVLPSHADNRVS